MLESYKWDGLDKPARLRLSNSTKISTNTETAMLSRMDGMDGMGWDWVGNLCRH